MEGGGGGRRWREAARDGFTVRRDKCQRWGVEGRWRRVEGGGGRMSGGVEGGARGRKTIIEEEKEGDDKSGRRTERVRT